MLDATLSEEEYPSILDRMAGDVNIFLGGDKEEGWGEIEVRIAIDKNFYYLLVRVGYDCRGQE